jgi:hypothetical protein
VASKEGRRLMDVTQGGEHGVQRRVFEDGVRIQDTRELAGGPAPGIERQLLDTGEADGMGLGDCMDMRKGSR